MPSFSVGSSGPGVSQLQQALKAQGFYSGTVDGKFGNGTAEAVRRFQQAKSLGVDGKAGPATVRALGLNEDVFEGSGTTTGPGSSSGTSGSVGNPSGTRYSSKGTGYYPHNSALEGGFKDRRGAPLKTLQDFLAGRSNYVSVAMDSNAFPYGTKLRIPELERKYGRVIEFRVVDTGGAFKNKGTSRIDICTANKSASLDPTVNGRLTLVRA